MIDCAHGIIAKIRQVKIRNDDMVCEGSCFSGIITIYGLLLLEIVHDYGNLRRQAACFR